MGEFLDVITYLGCLHHPCSFGGFSRSSSYIDKRSSHQFQTVLPGSIDNSKIALYGTLPHTNSQVSGKLIWDNETLDFVHQPGIWFILYLFVVGFFFVYRNGPLITSWCMRMEAKHSYFKRIAMIGNFKNVPLSVAKRHQRLMYSYINSKHFFNVEITTGPGNNFVKFTN